MKNGINFSLSILVSSSMYDNSFSSQRLKQVEGNKHVYIIDGKIWEVKEGAYSSERFYVFIGNESLDPMIIDSIADINSVLDSAQVSRITDNDLSIKDAMSLVPERLMQFFVAVPIDFRKRFEENIVNAIQDIAGIPIAPQGRLFSSKKHYNACLYNYNEDIVEITKDPNTDEDIVNHYTNKLFMKDEFVISTGSDVEMKDFCNPNYKPVHPERKRFLHIDQSISGDSTGLCCTYLDSVERNADGTLKKNIKVDWVIRVVPPKPPHKIDIKKVRGIITYLSNAYGIEWGMITYDTYGSQEAIQELEKDGFPCAFQSVDRTDEAYLTLVDYIYSNQIKFPYHPVFEKELFNLIHFRQKRKVDHPADGCLLGSQKIKVADGTDIPICELYLSGSDKFNVYSSSLTGEVVESNAYNCRITKYVNSYYRIFLSSGDIIECTDNHPIMLANGSYMRADELKINDHLMSISGNITVSNIALVVSNKEIPVYDLTVPIYENFALSCGVFVHNSKDVSDSVAGSLMNCLESDDVYSQLREDDIDYYLDGVPATSDEDDIEALLSNI